MERLCKKVYISFMNLERDSGIMPKMSLPIRRLVEVPMLATPVWEILTAIVATVALANLAIYLRKRV